MPNSTANPAGRPPVLVVGAGPTGLTATAELSRRGVPTRCVDAGEGPSALSRALLVWPRTLEVLRRLGGADRIAAGALPVGAFRYYSSGRPVADIAFDDRTRPVVLPQPDVEALLSDSVHAAGAQVDWGTRLIAYRESADGVLATLRGPDGTERDEPFSHVVGCDGTGSTVRRLAGVPFLGSAYPNAFMLADAMVEGDLRHDAVHYFCTPRGVLVIIGLPSGRFRVFTSGPPGHRPEDTTLELLQQMVDSRGPGGLRLRDPAWVSTFVVQRRRAGRYRAGRVFLAGDAAHVHSPAGGQGLNTGVTDAHNLAWKLALAWHGRAGDDLLDTYEAERAGVARSVVRQADLQTRAWLLTSPPLVAARDAAVRAAARTGILDRRYAPALAGLRTVYPVTGEGPRRRHRGRRWLPSKATRPGALLPDVPVWDAARGRRTGLRQALPDDRYTLLVRPVGEATPGSALTGLLRSSDLLPGGGPLDVRVLDHRGVLHALPDPAVEGDAPAATHPARQRLVLVRPDLHVAAVHGGPVTRTSLRRLLGNAH